MLAALLRTTLEHDILASRCGFRMAESRDKWLLSRRAAKKGQAAWGTTHKQPMSKALRARFIHADAEEKAKILADEARAEARLEAAIERFSFQKPDSSDEDVPPESESEVGTALCDWV